MKDTVHFFFFIFLQYLDILLNIHVSITVSNVREHIFGMINL
jgi:hypothetical protein